MTTTMFPNARILTEITHRDELPDFLNRHDLIGQAVELGTYFGEFAETILARWKGARLTLVDPYQQFPAGEYVDGSGLDPMTGAPIDWNEVFWAAQLRLAHFQAAHFVRQTSAAAAPLFTEDSLDLVYVDANHALEHVAEDIRLWWPKLAKGGIMGLHDCYSRDDGKLRCGVFEAVMDWAEEIHQRPRLTYCTTAWFLKL